MGDGPPCSPARLTGPSPVERSSPGVRTGGVWGWVSSPGAGAGAAGGSVKPRGKARDRISPTATAAGVWGGDGMAWGVSASPQQSQSATAWGYLIAEGLGDNSTAMGGQAGGERRRGGMAPAGCGVGLFYPFDCSEVIFRGAAPPPQPVETRSALTPQPGLLGWHSPRGGGSDVATCSGLHEARASSRCFFSSFLLLRALVGTSTARAWARAPAASLSLFPFLAGPGVTVPITAPRSPSPSPWPLPWPRLLPEQLERGEI